MQQERIQTLHPNPEKKYCTSNVTIVDEMMIIQDVKEWRRFCHLCFNRQYLFQKWKYLYINLKW